MDRDKHLFNMRVDLRTREDLDRLADVWRCSRAEVIRRLVMAANRHLFEGNPACADGGRCFVPHMHVKTEARG